MGEFNMEMTVTVNLDPHWRKLEDKYVKAVEIAARHVETKAKAKVPVDTGATKNSITAQPAEAGGLCGPVTAWRGGPTTEYAPFLEYGTIHMKARPFLIPALESEVPRLQEAIRQINNELAGVNPGAVRLI